MATIAVVAVGVLALLVFVLFGALLELYRDVRQLRDVAGILDRPLDVDIGPAAGARPSVYGLPPQIDEQPAAFVLFLSVKCGTCNALAASFNGSPPPGLWVVVEAGSADEAASFLDLYRLARHAVSGRVVVDLAGQIARRIGLTMTPVGFRVADGRLTTATTVPSSRYLVSVLPKPVRLTPGKSPWSTAREPGGSSEEVASAGAHAHDADGMIQTSAASSNPLSRAGMALLSAASGSRQGGE
jgi:hypothetical protein